MTIIVAITGGIGSGKSTFSKEIKKRRLKLLDSDKEVSLIYKNPNKDFLNYLKKIGLGKSTKNKIINKKYISDIIFSNKQIKQKLEKHIFKIVRKKRFDFIKKEKKRKTNTIFLDIPLLFENKLEKQFDIIVSIISKKETRLKRIKNKKKLPRKKFNNIINTQTSDMVRKKNSDILIYNNNTMKEYLIKINKVLDKLIL